MIARGAPYPTLEDLRHSQGRMVVARLVATPWIVAQIVLYATEPYPPGVQRVAFALAVVFALGNVAVWLAHRRAATVERARLVSVAGLTFDVLVASAFVWLYAFDEISALWAVLVILPLEGAILFALPGAIASWAAAAVLYVAREAWGSSRYGYPFLVDSISFRMGIALLVALVAGLMARDLLRQRARLADALEEVRRIDALRRGLVSTLAHDVRNPLAAIRGAVQTLRAAGRRLSPDDTQALLAGADRQVRRLERLSLGLLDLARLERGTIELDLQEVELREAVETALSYLAEGGRVAVDIPQELRVRADPARLEQVIVNLASNALTHGRPPFRITAAGSDGLVRLDVADGGPGVPEDRRAALFEPFETGGGRGSVGLGLPIVKGLVEAHGGRVSYLDADPTGACFRVELPRAEGARDDGAGAAGGAESHRTAVRQEASRPAQ